MKNGSYLFGTFKKSLESFLFVSLLLTMLLAVGCIYSYRPNITSDQFKDNSLKEVLQNIEQVQKESDWFSDQSRNEFEMYLSFSLALGALFGGALTIIEGTKLWKKSAKQRLVFLLILAFSVTVSSASGLFFKTESARFYKENRQQYSQLSLEINRVIRGFYIDIQEAGYNDNNIVERKGEFLSLARSTFDKIDDLKLTYGEKYNLNINPTLP